MKVCFVHSAPFNSRYVSIHADRPLTDNDCATIASVDGVDSAPATKSSTIDGKYRSYFVVGVLFDMQEVVEAVALALAAEVVEAPADVLACVTQAERRDPMDD